MIRLRWRLALATALLAGMTQAAAYGATDTLLDAVKSGRAAIHAWQFEAITNAATEVARAEAEESDTRWQSYWKGALLFHAVVFLREAAEQGRNAVDEEPFREAALEALKRTVKADAEASDAHAMISVLNGMAIDDNPLSALWRGRALLKHKELAVKTGPDNPRTAFLMGVSTFKRADGDKEEVREAVNHLEQARQLFLEETSEERHALKPGWGYDHTLLFLARANEQLGDYEKALVWYERTVAENPNLESASEGIERCRNLIKKQSS